MKKGVESFKLKGELTLTTKDQESLRVSGNKDYWGDREEHQVSATDFALANWIYQWRNKDNLTKLGKLAATVFLGSAFSSSFVHTISEDGSWFYFDSDFRSMGARPALSIIYDQKSPHEVREELSEDGNWTGRWVLDAGEYLKGKTDDQTDENLEKLFNNGRPQGGLKATGRWTTTSGINKWEQDFTPRMVSIFEIDGEKYGRVIENTQQTINRYADGTFVASIDKGKARWFKVEKTTLLVLNPETYKKDGEYLLETNEAILGNMPFYPNSNDEDRAYIEKSTMRAWMNGIKTQGGDFTHSIKLLPNGEKIRCGYGSFREDCFEPQEPIQHFEIPAWQSDIADYAYQGACHLKSMMIPNTVKEIGKGAFSCMGNQAQLRFQTAKKAIVLNESMFAGTDFLFIYVTKDGENVILSGQEDSELEETAYRFDYKLEDANKFLTTNYRENFVNLKNWRESGKIKFIPPEYTIETFPSSQMENYFLNSNNQRWGKLVKTLGFDTLEGLEKTNSLTDLMKIYYAIGGFSENQGQSEEAFAYMLDHVISKSNHPEYKPLSAANDIHKRFAKLTLHGAYNPVFAQFFMKYYRHNADFMNFRLKDEDGELMDPDDYLCSAHNSFERILKSYPNRVVNTNEENARLSPKFVAENCLDVEYEYVEEGNELLAETVARYGYTQDQFDEMQEVYNKAKTIKDVFYIAADKSKQADCITYRLLKKQDENILDAEGVPLPDPLGFALGDMTNCCMTWSNDRSLGASCVDDGYTNPNAGFLVFEESIKDEHGKETGDTRILGQAYIWYDPQTKTVCFDNIEIPTKVIKEMKKKDSSISVDAFLNAVADSAKAIIMGMNQKGTVVERVTLGTGYLDDEVDNKRLYDYYKERFGNPEKKPVAKHRDYSGYSDATSSQFLLATYDKKTKDISTKITETLDAAQEDINEATLANAHKREF